MRSGWRCDWHLTKETSHSHTKYIYFFLNKVLIPQKIFMTIAKDFLQFCFSLKPKTSNLGYESWWSCVYLKDWRLHWKQKKWVSINGRRRETSRRGCGRSFVGAKKRSWSGWRRQTRLSRTWMNPRTQCNSWVHLQTQSKWVLSCLLFSAHISYGKGKYLNQTGFFFYKICQEILFT